MLAQPCEHGIAQPVAQIVNADGLRTAWTGHVSFDARFRARHARLVRTGSDGEQAVQ